MQISRMTGIVINLVETKNTPKLKTVKRFNRVLYRIMKDLIVSF